MGKYRVQMGSLVTRLAQRTFVVSAQSEEEAIEKAEDRFRYACAHNKVYTDCGDTVICNFIERIDEK